MQRNDVGPVLKDSDEARAVIEAIVEQNRDARVTDHGSYSRVSVPSFCVLNRALVEEKLGREFPLPRSLEAIMPSFSGSISFKQDRVTWQI
jgi:hypothetical protein